MKQVCSGGMLVAGDCRMAVGLLRLVTESLKHMTARSKNTKFGFCIQGKETVASRSIPRISNINFLIVHWFLYYFRLLFWKPYFTFLPTN